MTAHHSLINTYLALGYSQKEVKGLCRGTSMRWLEASLLHEDDLFDKRITNIINWDENLPQLIDEAKAKKDKALSDKDRELLDIHPFFDSVSLFQSPGNYDSVFTPTQENNKTPVGVTPFIGLNQGDIETLSTYASSDKIKSLGGLTSLYSEAVIGTNEEISDYFSKLGSLIEETQLTQDTFGFMLGSDEHAIAITYTRGKGWGFMDINQYPTKRLAQLQTKELATLISKGEGFSESIEDSYTSFHLSFITTKTQLPSVELTSLTEKLDEFKNNQQKMRFPSPEIMDKRNFVHTVVDSGRVDLIEKLAINGADFNKVNDSGFAPAHVAAIKGNIEMLKALKKSGADLNKFTDSGDTPAHIAAIKGNIEMLKALKKMGADLNTATDNGYTLPQIATVKSNVALMVFLGESGVDLNKANSKPSPAVMAVLNNDVAILNTLIQFGADLRTTLRMGEVNDLPSPVKPYRLATGLQRTEIIQLLEQHQVALDLETTRILTTQKTVFFKLMHQLKTIEETLALKFNEDPELYQQVHEAVHQFYTNLESKGTLFFNSPNLNSLGQLRAACQAYKSTKEIAQTHRGIWYQIHPIIRGILGVLAALTLIPAFIVGLTQKDGYTGTFFSTPQTDSEVALDAFQHQMGEQLKL